MGARRRVAKPSTPRWQRPAWLKPRLLGAGVLLSVLGTGLGLGGWSLAQPDTLPIRRVQVAGEFTIWTATPWTAPWAAWPAAVFSMWMCAP
jgi:hypothetical protein